MSERHSGTVPPCADRAGQLSRKVLNCFVFGAKASHAQTVLAALIGKEDEDEDASSSGSGSKISGKEDKDISGSRLSSSRIDLDEGAAALEGIGNTWSATEKSLVMHAYVPYPPAPATRARTHSVPFSALPCPPHTLPLSLFRERPSLNRKESKDSAT